MPRGGGRGKKNYKGQRRHFTSQEEIDAEKEKERKDKEWRQKRGETDDIEEGEEGSDATSESEESSEEEEEEKGRKAKGIEALIQIENPNRAKARNTKKVTELGTDGEGQQLSRREREELEKQRAAENYRKMHEAGKTEEARADLARLAIIRKQREEAAKKRELAAKAASAQKK